MPPVRKSNRDCTLIRKIVSCRQRNDKTKQNKYDVNPAYLFLKYFSIILSRMFTVATLSQFILITSYLQLKVDTGFLHLKLLTLIWKRICRICCWRWQIWTESFKPLLPTERFCGSIRGSIVEEAQYLIVVLAHQQNPFTSKSPMSNIFLCGHKTGMAKK